MESVSSVTGFSQSFSHIDDPAFLIYKEFVKEHHIPDIIRILLQSETAVHYSVVSDCSTLLKTNVDFAEELFCQSEEVLRNFSLALRAVSKDVYSSHPLKHQMKLKPYLHARLNKFPKCEELWRHRIPKSKDIGQFLALEGTVIRTSSVKLLEYQKELMCTKCKHVFTVKSEFSQNYKIATPTKCPNNLSCNSKKFMIISASTGIGASSKCKDFQEVRIQEQIRRLAMGTIPRTITVVLEDDLVDGCKAGDDVIIYGCLICRWRPSQPGKPCELEIVVKANNVEVRNDQQLDANIREEMQNDFDCFWVSYDGKSMTARNHILASLCPQIYGLYVVKLAVALVLAGGVAKTDESGSRVRGEAHLLMVGDPGTGKSQFLKYATKITPRSILTTGIGSTTAGLTVSAVRDGPHWTLEAGALVLADGGLCCIDEFSSIKEHDRCAIHEAMEQQTVHVAKAGLVCKLNTRTSVLAATNPKLGKYDESSDLSVNLAIGSPLLSRFDIILVLLDGKNERWDSVVADYLLMGKDTVQEMRGDTGKPKLWSLEQMQAYFCLIHQLKPVLTPGADKILSAYYRCHRRSNVRNAARTTIRLLESLIRLAEAHARLMYRETVEIQDAVAAITIMESSMHGSSLLPTGSVLHSCFPADAEKEYYKHERLVLQCLGLEDMISKDNPISASSSANNGFNSKLSNNVNLAKEENKNLTQNKSQTSTANRFPTVHSQNTSINEDSSDSFMRQGGIKPSDVPGTSKNCQVRNNFKTRDSTKSDKNWKSIFELDISDDDFNLNLDIKSELTTVESNFPVMNKCETFSKRDQISPPKCSIVMDQSNSKNTKKAVHSAENLNFSSNQVACEQNEQSWLENDLFGSSKPLPKDPVISYSPSEKIKRFQNKSDETLDPSLIEELCADMDKENKNVPTTSKENLKDKSIFNLPADVFFPSQLSYISQTLKQHPSRQNKSPTETPKSTNQLSSIFEIDRKNCDLDLSLNFSNFDVDWDPSRLSDDFNDI